MPNIKLRDVNGAEVVYQNIDTLTVPDATSGTQTFYQPTRSETITENGVYDVGAWVEATVDVSSAKPEETFDVTPTTTDQTVTPTEGKVFSSGIVRAVTAGVAGTPTAVKGTVSEHSVNITPTVTNETGYIIGSTETGTPVTVTAAELVNGNTQITTLGEVDVANYATASINDANLRADNIRAGATILGIDGTFSDDATAVAGEILAGATAYVNGAEITGSMANRGDVSATITEQSGSVTIPAGYTSGGTINAVLPATTLDNTIVSGTAYQEVTGDYGFRATVQVPQGYHNAVTITKDFSEILPEPETEGSAAQLLTGFDMYTHEGVLVNGAMPNNGAVSATLNDTQTSYTIPAGFHSGSGKVTHATVDIPNPTISVNSSDGLITASGSWTKGFTTDSSYSNTKQLSTQSAATITPSTSAQTAVEAGKYTLGAVTVAAIQTETKTATANGVVTPTSGKYLTSVTVAIPVYDGTVQ